MSRKRDRKKPAAPARPAGPRTSSDPPLERYAFWIAAALLVVLLVAFFNPLFVGGKTFQPPDNLASLAHRTFLTDAFGEGDRPLMERFPLWTPYIFSGMPSYASLMAAPYTNPISLALFYVPPHVKVVAYYLVMGLFTWLLLRRLRLGNLPAVTGAVSFVFCTHVITLIMFGHNSKVATLVFLPLVLTATLETWRRPTLRWGSLLALAVGCMLLASHMQVSYYTFLAAGLLVLVFLVSSVRGGMGWGAVAARLAAGGAALGVGVLSASALLIPVREYTRYSIRGGTEGGLPYEFATNWSLHPLETATFFIPSFLGFGDSTYWGWMPFTHFPLYMGILPLFLAVLALVLWPRDRITVFFALLGAFSLLVAFGKHLPVVYDALFSALPFFNKFRVPSMITFLLQLSVAALAAVSLDRIMRGLPGLDMAAARRRFLVTAAAFVAVTVLLGGIAAGGMLSADIAENIGRRVGGQLPPDQLATYGRQIADEVADKARGDFVRVLLVLATGLVLLFWRLRGRIPNLGMGAGILLLVVIDLWVVGAKPATYSDRPSGDTVFRPTGAVEYLQARPGPFRVLPLAGAGAGGNGLAYFRLESILGYHPAKVKIYNDLIDERGLLGVRRSLGAGNFNLLDMLNTEYLIVDRNTADALARAMPDRFRVVHGGPESVVENAAALPRAWFVDRARVVADEAQHLQAVSAPGWNPADEALLFEDPGPLDPGAGGSVTIEDHRPREIRAVVDSPGRSLLVLSEVYYPAGWTVTLDGEPAEFLRADYALRGVVVPQGRHELVARFDPPSFRRSVFLSFGSFGLILLALAASFVVERRRRGGEPAA